MAGRCLARGGASRVVRNLCAGQPELTVFARALHSTPANPATPLPVTAHGPPPGAPLPAASQYADRIARRKQKAELIQRGRDARAAEKKPGGGLKRRFWSDVHVKESPEGLQIHLDTRPVRTPSKRVLTVSHKKPHLASAIALEWDLLVSAQQALKHHLIPMTSLVSRAEDIKDQDKAGDGRTRDEIVDVVMRYLDTDTMLCWAPETSTSQVPEQQKDRSGRTRTSLRELQVRSAQPIIAFLCTHVWPGVEIHPVTDSESIVPRAQPQMTRDVIRGWVSGLPAYELAGLERAVLAGKGLLAAARLVVEWSPEFEHLRRGSDGQRHERFGVDEAADAASVEVTWQTGVWGEVEDTHDVDREDLRRQLGSVILLLAETADV